MCNLCSMSFLRIDAFGGKGRPASGDEGAVPPNATLCIELELISWKTVTEIGDDRKIIKKTLKEGEGYQKPNEGAVVTGSDPEVISYMFNITVVAPCWLISFIVLFRYMQ